MFEVTDNRLYHAIGSTCNVDPSFPYCAAGSPINIDSHQAPTDATRMTFEKLRLAECGWENKPRMSVPIINFPAPSFDSLRGAWNQISMNRLHFGANFIPRFGGNIWIIMDATDRPASNECDTTVHSFDSYHDLTRRATRNGRESTYAHWSLPLSGMVSINHRLNVTWPSILQFLAQSMTTFASKVDVIDRPVPN